MPAYSTIRDVFATGAASGYSRRADRLRRRRIAHQRLCHRCRQRLGPRRRPAGGINGLALTNVYSDVSTSGRGRLCLYRKVCLQRNGHVDGSDRPSSVGRKQPWRRVRRRRQRFLSLSEELLLQRRAGGVRLRDAAGRRLAAADNGVGRQWRRRRQERRRPASTVTTTCSRPPGRRRTPAASPPSSADSTAPSRSAPARLARSDQSQSDRRLALADTVDLTVASLSALNSAFATTVGTTAASTLSPANRQIDSSASTFALDQALSVTGTLGCRRTAR